MISCNELWKKEKELKKYSIYLLDDDLKNRDFEFFIFIDPDNPKDRPSFLKELFNIIKSHKSNGRKFVVPKHKEELKKWIGTEYDNDSYLTPLNWLKIAIERYPYRLIVITDKKNYNNIPEFVKRRICFLDKKFFFDFFNPNKSNKIDEIKEKIIKSIYFSYLDYLIKNRYKSKNAIYIFFYDSPESEKPYYPPTLPPFLKPPSDPDRSSQTPGQNKSIKIDIQNKSFEFVQYPWPQNNEIGIYLSKHVGLFPFDNKNCNWKIPDGDVSNYIYSEALSGSVSYTSQIYIARDKLLDNFSSQIFYLKFVEQSLLRIGICDERFQEWWAKLSDKNAGYIFQSRILPAYLENEKIYGQHMFPERFFLVLKKDDWQEAFYLNKSKEGNSKGDSVINMLWPSIDQKIDLLIIHQGILDRWKSEDKSSNIITKEILTLKEKIPYIIITSGRGRPDNIPTGIKFLSFSNIESCLVGNYIERLTLMRQIMNIKEIL